MLKKSGILLLLCSLFMLKATYAQRADDILGKWINPSGEGQILIYKKGNLYFGKLAWIKVPNDETGKPKTDIKNPNASLRSRPILNLEILKSFKADNDNTYEDGTIYDPKSGKTYSCKMTLNGNQLKIRGYIGVSLLGRTEVFTRVK
ncbi:DUF2147 domain-containing protein [Mucilaginibacter robiniae]|uniref:DUF2147 domain-containing protein n=1 Tax=Mucilaginibacter robiniae TaxID=2728022 RepID=A0A7L5DVP5_9SPHI|nr:DUF2147 domain-containing protein [Mucilaginibacter robiniae]QJD95175.1 DUF2147 domain-containing protein [Mucilaginibacter robiniae]